MWEKVVKTSRYYGARVVRILRGLRCRAGRPRLQQPVFVVGCSRGGTTLVYKIFSQASELGSLQREIHDYWAELQPLARRQWRSHVLEASQASDADRDAIACYFYTHTGETRIVDKNNQSGFSIPYLYAMFPDAHFVFVTRNPGDNINSLVQGWGKPDEFGAWSEDLPAEVAIDNGRYRRWCFFLPEGWRDFTRRSIEEVGAWQYAEINTAILAARARVPASQWIEIRYEELLSDPILVVRDAFTRCGLTFDARVEARCAQAISVPYNAFSEIRVHKWREGAWAARISRVLPQVEPVAAQLGYAGLQESGSGASSAR